MSLFVPSMYVNGVMDINIDLLRDMNIKGIILDVDDTIAEHGSQVPFRGVTDWILKLKNYGIKIIILSNNLKKRVKPFAEKVGIPFVSVGLKPAPFGIIKALRKISLNKEEVVMVGDQIFTDILGANIYGLKSILIEPIGEPKSINLKMKRKFEKRIKQKLKSQFLMK